MSTRNPWKTLESRYLFKGNWLRLREDDVICPDGSSGTYTVVEAVKLASGVVAVNESREIYLVGQYRYPTRCYSWEIIEGGVEVGEEPLAAAKRELQEEAGLRAKEWTPLSHRAQLSNCFTDEEAVIFLAQDLTVVPSTPDRTEVIQVKTVPFQESLAMIDRGEILDAVSIMGILMAARHFDRVG